MRHEFKRTEHRSLSAQERTLIEWLLVNGGVPDARSYLNQVPRARVVSRCTCGCPTIDVALDGHLSGRKGGSDIVADVEGISPEGGLVGVILHSRDGELSELEVYSIDGLSDRFSLPTPDLLKPALR